MPDTPGRIPGQRTEPTPHRHDHDHDHDQCAAGGGMMHDFDSTPREDIPHGFATTREVVKLMAMVDRKLSDHWDLAPQILAVEEVVHAPCDDPDHDHPPGARAVELNTLAIPGWDTLIRQVDGDTLTAARLITDALRSGPHLCAVHNVVAVAVISESWVLVGTPDNPPTVPPPGSSVQDAPGAERCRAIWTLAADGSTHTIIRVRGERHITVHPRTPSYDPCAEAPLRELLAAMIAAGSSPCPRPGADPTTERTTP